MVYILNIYPNTSWNYSKFIPTNSNEFDEIKKTTSTNRVIGPINCQTYQLCIFYRFKAKEELNILASQFAQNAFHKRKWSNIRGTVTVVKLDLDGTLIDVTFDDFFNVYLLYLKTKHTSKRKRFLDLVYQKFTQVLEKL